MFGSTVLMLVHPPAALQVSWKYPAYKRRSGTVELNTLKAFNEDAYEDT